MQLGSPARPSPSGTSSAGHLEAGCLAQGSPYGTRALKPALRAVSLDRLDNCHEVTLGSVAVILTSLLFCLFAIPLFDTRGISWISSWEGSGMTLHKAKLILAEREAYTESIFMEFSIHGVPGDTFSRASATDRFKDVITVRLQEAAGTVALSRDGITLKFSPGSVKDVEVSVEARTLDSGLAAGTDLDTAQVRADVESNLDKLARGVESDLLADDEFRAAASGAPIVLRAHPPTSVDPLQTGAESEQQRVRINNNLQWVYYQRLDKNKDNRVDMAELFEVLRAGGCSTSEAQVAYFNLNRNGDDHLDYEELQGAMHQRQFGDEYRPEDYTTDSTTVAPGEAPTAAPSTAATTARATTAAPATTAAAASTARPKAAEVVSTTPAPPPTTAAAAEPFVTVRLSVGSIRLPGLAFEDKIGFAKAFRDDLAYAAGILSKQVFGVRGDSGCTTVAGTEDDHLMLLGCIRIPDGATEGLIEAVVTSGTSVNKLVRDIVAVDNRETVGMHDMQVTLTPVASCDAATGKKDRGVDYCDSMVTTTTPEPTTTTQMVLESRYNMQWFLEQLGATSQDSARDVFAILDRNVNEFADYDEFMQIAMNERQMKHALTHREAEQVFAALDKNADGRIESLEFYESYTDAMHAMSRQAPQGLMSLSQYREILGHAVTYSKVGVGWCRTASEAEPGSSSRDLGSKEACRGLCDKDNQCGAFAYHAAGSCRIYKAGHDYVDTMGMADSECFRKHVDEQASYDLVRVTFVFTGSFSSDVVRTVTGETELAAAVAFEVGQDARSVKNSQGVPRMCSFVPRGKRIDGKFAAIEASCFVDLKGGEHLEDIKAVIEASKSQIVSRLSEVSSMSSLKSEDVEARVEGTSLKFRNADVDSDGRVSGAELVVESKSWFPPLTKEEAEFVMKGLDVNGDKFLSPAEFEADGMTTFFTPSSETLLE